MSERTCAGCGKPLDATAGGKLCPACRARRYLEPAPPASSGAEEEEEDAAELKTGTLSDYELLESVAEQGAFGEVCRARHKRLDREVAIKLLSRSLFDGQAGEKPVQRFEIEARAMARLPHPYIVQLYEMGTTEEDRPWFSMEWVKGQSLARQMSDQHWHCGQRANSKAQQRKVAEFLLRVCEAVHYAHERGVIHRDLKPANIMVKEGDEPRVCDFGLAKLLRESNQVSESREIKGTLTYMAPEQAQGSRELTVRVDVYALGVMLYEMLTGRLPHQGNTEELLQGITQHEPPAPRTLNPLIDADLETICLRCLAKSAAERPSAEAVAHNLRCFLEGKPITLRPVTVVERMVKWCRRNPRLAILYGSLALAVVATVVLWSRTQQAVAKSKNANIQMNAFGTGLAQRDLVRDKRGLETLASMEYMGELTGEMERTLGAEHFCTLAQRCNFGVMLRKGGHWDEAYEQLELVVAAVRRQPMPGGELLALAASCYLGEVCLDQSGQGTNTVKLLEAQKYFEDVTGSAAPNAVPWPLMLKARMGRGATLLQTSQTAKAVVEWRKAFALAKERHGPADVDTLKCATLLCASLLPGGQATNEISRVLDEAVPACLPALRAQTNRLAAGEVCASIAQLAKLSAISKRFDAAEQLLLDSIQLLDSHPAGAGSKELRDSYDLVIKLRHAAGEPASARGQTRSATPL